MDSTLLDRVVGEALELSPPGSWKSIPHTEASLLKVQVGKKMDPASSQVWLAYEKETDFANAFGREASRLRKLLAAEGFTGAEGQGAVLHRTEGTEKGRVVALGLGLRSVSNAESFRRAGGRLARKCREFKIETVSVEWPERGLKGDLDVSAKALAEGALLGAYTYSKFITVDLEKLRGLQSLAFTGRASSRLASVLKDVEIQGRAVCFARDLVNGPASEVTPSRLVKEARRIAALVPGMSLKVFGRAELKRMGAGGLLGINAGSSEEPFLIHLHYKKGRAKRVALVGKGITFDSGGLSLKPAASMETMKMDMSGAAAVLGVFQALAETRPNADVHGIIAATENMPGGPACKPGDVLRAMNGKTMEILNTDAEGRVILADAISYAVRQKPEALIDLATLTGACVVALGPHIAGALSNDGDLFARIRAASEIEGERLWEMPLVKDYRSEIRSRIADMKNIGGNREAGTIIGGLFLQEFVGETPWVHLDIAGPAWMDRDAASLPYMPAGGTGFFIRSLLSYLRNP